MTTWLVGAIAFAQIVVLYWVGGPVNIRLAYRYGIDKNPEWVKSHAEFAQRFVPRYALFLSYAAGAAWIVWLVRCFLFDDANRWLIASLILPILSCLVLQLGYFTFAYYRIWKRIPLPLRRSAALQRRSLRDFIRPSWVYAGYALVGLAAIVYVCAFETGKIASTLFTARMSGLAVASSLSAISLYYSIRRKKQAIDEALGEGYRKIEILGNVFLLYLLVGVGTWRILQDLFGVRPFSDLGFFSVMSLLIQAVSLWFCFHGAVRRLAGPDLREEAV